MAEKKTTSARGAGKTAGRSTTTRTGTSKKKASEALRLPLLAGIGLISLASDELEVIGKRLVEKGQSSEKVLRDTLEKFFRERGRAVGDLKEMIESAVTRALKARKGVTTADLEKLQKRIDQLSAKVDRLARKVK